MLLGIRIKLYLDRKIFVIKRRVESNLLLDFADDWENPRLAVVIPVGADTEVHLFGILVGTEVGRQLEDGYWRRELNISEKRHFQILFFRSSSLSPSEFVR